jgi:uncharacterized protein (DUF1778 family)
MQIEEHERGVAVVPDRENVEQMTSLEWAQNVQTIELPVEALVLMHELVDAPPRPSARLLEAAKRQRQQR